MKKISILSFVLVSTLFISGTAFAANAQGEQPKTNAPEIAGDGIQNATQDAEYGHTGEGNPSNKASAIGAVPTKFGTGIDATQTQENVQIIDGEELQVMAQNQVGTKA